jgi:hypothetical protein
MEKFKEELLAMDASKKCEAIDQFNFHYQNQFAYDVVLDFLTDGCTLINRFTKVQYKLAPKQSFPTITLLKDYCTCGTDGPCGHGFNKNEERPLSMEFVRFLAKKQGFKYTLQMKTTGHAVLQIGAFTFAMVKEFFSDYYPEAYEVDGTLEVVLYPQL